MYLCRYIQLRESNGISSVVCLAIVDMLHGASSLVRGLSHHVAKSKHQLTVGWCLAAVFPLIVTVVVCDVAILAVIVERLYALHRPFTHKTLRHAKICAAFLLCSIAGSTALACLNLQGANMHMVLRSNHSNEACPPTVQFASTTALLASVALKIACATGILVGYVFMMCLVHKTNAQVTSVVPTLRSSQQQQHQEEQINRVRAFVHLNS